VFLAADRPVQEWLKPVAGQENVFRTDGVGRLLANPDSINDVTFQPFYKTHRRTYGVYFDLIPTSGLDEAIERYRQDEERRRIEANTLAFAQPGEMQAERDFNYQSSVEERPVEALEGRNGRAGPGWFSFDMSVEAGRPAKLRVTYHSGAMENAAFDIFAGDTRIGRQPATSAATGFFEAEYDIPAELTRDKESVTVRFQAAEGGRVAAIFGLRTVAVPQQQEQD
jgi:hypothetical protein